jgi:hypothetical protein
MATRNIVTSSALAGLLLMMSSGAMSGELEDRFERQLRQAKAGDIQAMYAVGELYELGMGTRSDRDKALTWYRAAANNGHAEGAYQLGYAHYWGKGVEKDRSQAHVWFLRAAERGNQAAMPYLSKMYALGQGVSQDKAEAQRWADRAATASNLMAPPPAPEVTQPAPPPRAEPTAAAEPPRPAATAAPRATPKPAAKRKPAAKPRPELARSQMTQLLASHWLKGSRPALYLPSSETRCHDEDRQITCHSEPRRSSLMGRAYGFRIVATLSDFDGKGGFRLSYRPEVTGVLQAGPGGYAAGDDGGESISEEQLRARVEREPHKLTCSLRDERTIRCRDDHGKTQEYSGVEPTNETGPDAVVFSRPQPGSGRTGGVTPPLQQPLLVAQAESRRIRTTGRRP